MGWETPRPPSPLNPSIPCARAQLRPRRGEAGRALRELSVQHHRAPAAAAGPAPPLPDSPPRQSHSTLSFSSLIPVIVRREHPRNYDDAELPVKLSFVQGYNRVYAFSLSALAPYALVSLHCDREVCLQKRWLKSIICHRSIKSSKISSKYFFPPFFLFLFLPKKRQEWGKKCVFQEAESQSVLPPTLSFLLYYEQKRDFKLVRRCSLVRPLDCYCFFSR